MNVITRRLLPSISKLLLKHPVASRTFSSVQNVSDKSQEIFVVGHRNPDTDSIISAIVFTDFLRRMHINAKPYRLGDLNNETKFVLNTAGVSEPHLLPDDVPDGTPVALVDHNESEQSMKNLKKMRITHVIDHHKLGDLTTSEPIYLRFEPVGCTATILTKLYREHNLTIDQTIALLLTSAIISDTLHFRSATTTNDDRNILEYLQTFAEIDDISSYANKMFQAKSDLKGFSVRQILLLEYKNYTFNKQTWGIGVSETCSMEKILERKDELLKEMNEEKQRNNLHGILFSIIDIIKEKNLTLTPGNIESKVVQEAFKVNVHNQIADLGSRLSRKKQIIPVLEAYFNSKS